MFGRGRIWVRALRSSNGYPSLPHRLRTTRDELHDHHRQHWLLEMVHLLPIGGRIHRNRRPPRRPRDHPPFHRKKLPGPQRSTRRTPRLITSRPGERKRPRLLSPPPPCLTPCPWSLLPIRPLPDPR